MSQFNLIDEKWIPVRFSDGRLEEIGLRAVLHEAKDIEGIEDASPLVVASLYRFLLAVLYRALQGPCDIEEAKALFKAGLPLKRIDAYLEKWRDRFWLFHEKYPFGQIPDFEPKAWRSWTVLAAENNAYNAKMLFDHTDVNFAGKIDNSKAARQLLATMTFSVSAGKSELSHTGSAPSATAAMAFPLGMNLQDTLMLNLLPERGKVSKRDKAVWERKIESLAELKSGIERSVSGFADRYSWRTRSVRFITNDNGEITKLAFASGVRVKLDDQKDPMLAYREDEKNGILPIQFKERGLWRDFDSLIPDASGNAPKVIEHAINLTAKTPDRFPRTILTLGQATNKAKVEYWRMERFALPQALQRDNDIREEIRELLSNAEKYGTPLWRACRGYAVDVLTRGSREPAKSDVTMFIRQMTVLDRYWSILEEKFHEILREYTLDKSQQDIELAWLKAIRDAMRTAWGEHRQAVSIGNAWAIRACTKAEAIFGKAIGELTNTIEQLEPEKEEP